jgi:superfamily II DNA or RNA helicase
MAREHVQPALPEAAGGTLFGAARLAPSLWPHQRRALAAFERDRAQGDAATYLVVPPGGGKTLIGLEVARRLGRPTVVLCPNTAIQSQWITQWHTAFAPVTVTATTSRELPTALTVLTYQAVCTLSADGNGGEPGEAAGPAAGPGAVRVGGRLASPGRADGSALLSLLHPNGRALIERLRSGGPWTLVLDECHHLLELWGRLLKTVLGQLDHPHVIGLTATPPHMMTADQAELHRALFGSVDLEISAPALVRDGRLAPYQELAYFTRPTPSEADYIHGESVRFAELRADLLDPQFASTPFLAWLQARVVERRGREGAPVSWQRFEHDEPALADAAVRLHVAGLLPLPDGAQVRERHRHEPAADDWVALIEDYCRRCLLATGHPRDQDAYNAIRRALPSVGYRLTRTGARASDSPVDRVLGRSESKARAVIEILSAESADLGPALRSLVLCDFEEASGTLPSRLTGVIPAEAGGAQLTLETLLADQSTAALDPVLMTGRRLACGTHTAPRLLAWLRDALPGLDLAAQPTAMKAPIVEITGPGGWDSRRYVPLVTRFFTDGGSRCLVGTRALLGEGWDAPAVNVVVDLTVATTPTSVVQARGRALRLDPAWPAKVADNWAVVCVTDDHPKGGADFDRFVRKHDRYFALARTGDIISGVPHVDPGLSPFAPPQLERFDALNAAMLQRAGEREAARGLWAIGTPYQEQPVATVTVRTRRSLGLPSRAAAPLMPRSSSRRWTAIAAVAVLIAVAALAAPAGAGAAWAAAAGGTAFLLAAATAAGRTAARVITSSSHGSLEDMAVATADALHAAGMTGHDSTAVRVEALADGSYRARLEEVTSLESELFSTALEEVLSPLSQPRYVVPRLIIPPPPGRSAALRLAVHRVLAGHVPASVVYHAVPTILGARKPLATAFQRAWNRHVSPGDLVYTGSPEGAGILAAQRGDDPFAITTQIRTLWH